MIHKKLINDLQEKYNVIIRSIYHIQIDIGVGKHNIYFNHHGDIKLQLYGIQHPLDVSPVEIMQYLEQYKYEETELSELKSVHKLVKEFKLTKKVGIFVDAGYKNGFAKIAIIRIYEGRDFDISVRHTICDKSHLAEILAIQLALKHYPDETKIYSDCISAVKIINNPRVEWLARQHNKTADSYSKLRGKNK